MYIHYLQDVFSELLVPVFSVNANRMKGVVSYSLAKCLSQFTENRRGLLLKSSFVSEEVARALLDHGYKHLSQFGYACPVQVSQSLTFSTVYTYTWSLIAVCTVVPLHEVCTYVHTCLCVAHCS